MIWGRTAKRIIWKTLAPVALTASIGPESIFSMASENNLPIKAKDVIANANIPANGPIPTQKTKIAT